MKPKLVICYHYFLPAIKACEPIKSIAHLIMNVHNDYEIFVITSNTDLGEQAPINVIPNT